MALAVEVAGSRLGTGKHRFAEDRGEARSIIHPPRVSEEHL
jgi:hypothetical protein